MLCRFYSRWPSAGLQRDTWSCWRCIRRYDSSISAAVAHSRRTPGSCLEMLDTEDDDLYILTSLMIIEY